MLACARPSQSPAMPGIGGMSARCRSARHAACPASHPEMAAESEAIRYLSPLRTMSNCEDVQWRPACARSQFARQVRTWPPWS
jgi:hypothetical protein